MKVKGTKGIHILNVQGFKGMTKETFLKKYTGKLIDINKVWDNIQSELKPVKKAEEAKKDTKSSK